MHCFGEPALEHVSIGEKIVSIRVPGIEREGGGEIAFGLGKMVAIDVAGKNKERRAVRQTWPSNREFFLGPIVVAPTSEEKISAREVRLGRIGAKA